MILQNLKVYLAMFGIVLVQSLFRIEKFPQILTDFYIFLHLQEATFSEPQKHLKKKTFPCTKKL